MAFGIMAWDRLLLFIGAELVFSLTPGPTVMMITAYLLLFVITFIGESVILTGYGWLAATGARTIGSQHAVWRERISGAVLLGLGLFALFEL
jgi:threonine/homoserine/homoserine lactone efflux protein